MRITTPGSVIEKIQASFEVKEGAQAIRVIWAGLQLTLSASTHLNETNPPVSSEQPALLLVNNHYGDLESTSFALHELLDINNCHTILRYTPTTMMVLSRAGYMCSAQTFAEAGHTHGEERPRLTPVQFNPKNQDFYLVFVLKTKATQPQPKDTAQRPWSSGDARMSRAGSSQRDTVDISPKSTPRGSASHQESSVESTISTKGTIQQTPQTMQTTDQIQQLVAQIMSNTLAQSAIETRLLEEERKQRDDRANQVLVALMETINKASVQAEEERQRNAVSQALVQQALLSITQRQDQLQQVVTALPPAISQPPTQTLILAPPAQEAAHMTHSILPVAPPAPVSTKRHATSVPVSDAASISSNPVTPGRSAKKTDTTPSPVGTSAPSSKPHGALPQPLNLQSVAVPVAHGAAQALSLHSPPGAPSQPGAPNAQHQTSQGANLVTVNTTGTTAAAAPLVRSVRPTARANEL